MSNKRTYTTYMNLANGTNKMNTQSNVVYLETLIAVPDTSAITDDAVVAVYEAVVAMKQKIEAQKLFLDKGIEILKQYMGDSDVLISKDGRRLATWQQQCERKQLNTELLKSQFPLEYELCCELKSGNRPFVLK